MGNPSSENIIAYLTTSAADLEACYRLNPDFLCSLHPLLSYTFLSPLKVCRHVELVPSQKDWGPVLHQIEVHASTFFSPPAESALCRHADHGAFLFVGAGNSAEG